LGVFYFDVKCIEILRATGEETGGRMNKGKMLLLAVVFSGSIRFSFAQDYALDLGKINIQATRTSVPISDISQSVTVITQDDIQKSTATSVTDVIAAQSGIFVTNYMGNPKGVKMDMRGFGETSASNFLVLVDGRRTNQVDMSGVDWGQISLDSVDHIEVLKGPATVLYGDNASAGVVNIVTKTGYQSNEPPIKVESEAGSFGYWKSSFAAQGTAKHFDYFLNFSHQDKDGYRQNNNYWANDLLGNLKVCPTDKVSVDLSSGYHLDQYGMPGALFASDIATLGRKASTHPEDRGWTSDYFINIDPKIVFPLKAQDVEFSWFSSFRKRFNKSLSVDSWGRWDTAHEINSFELRPKLSTEILMGERAKNNFVTGFDYFYAKDKVRSGYQGSAEDFVNITKETFGIYALNDMEFMEKFLVNMGGRATWADYDFDQRQVAVNKEKKSISDGALNAGVGYKYRENSQVYFDYARSFRLPTTDEYYQNKYLAWGGGGGLNTDLKHQVSHNYELGIRDFSLPWLKTDMNLFLMDVKNEIYYDPLTYKNSNYSPMTRHWGFELEGKAQVFRNTLEPFINWTWQDAFFKGGEYSGHKVPFVPQNKISSGVSVNLSERIKTTFSVNYIGKSFAISDQANAQAKLNSYVTFDFKTDFSYKGLKVWFGVKNMFDRLYDAYGVYSSSAGKVGFYPAEGRSFLGGVSYEF